MDNILFKNIGGYESQKREAMKIVNFFKNYSKFKENGARITRGLLLYGLPGTGKTTFAKAIVNEANAKLFELVPKEVTDREDTISSIRNAFKMARENSPSIILIDEIDRIISCSNGFMSDETDSEREALRCLISEIDNSLNSDVVVIATSNSSRNSIPAALVRSGRIEKSFKMDPPGQKERESILSLYLKRNDIFSDISSKDVALYTQGFTGASLENLVNDVLIDCINKNSKAKFNDFLEPIESIKCAAIKNKSDKDNSDVIYHELGHFITDYVLNDKIGMINTFVYGSSSGRYSMLEDEDNTESDNQKLSGRSKTELLNNAVTAVAGLAATKIYLNDEYLGAESDYSKLYSIYLLMASSGLLGAQIYSEYAFAAPSNFGEESLITNSSELKSHFSSFINDAKAKAESIIKANDKIVRVLYAALKERQVLTHKEIEDLIKDIPVVRD